LDGTLVIQFVNKRSGFGFVQPVAVVDLLEERRFASGLLLCLNRNVELVLARQPTSTTTVRSPRVASIEGIRMVSLSESQRGTG
jgi:hypothetical protein